MRRYFPVFVVFFLFSVPAQSQQIESTIAKYATDYAQERAYVHYDKSVYAPGETIWFKVYLMEGPFPAENSKTFYADWTDEQGKLIHRTTSPIIEGTTNGQFEIPATYTGKYIHIRAYTKWMLNFDSAFIYNKDIRILSTSGNNTLKTTVTPTLEFFPEGGDVISGLVNKIAFKAHDQWGRPVRIKGVIQDGQGKTIDTLRSQHDAMGYIYLSPKPGETFTAIWKDEKNTEHKTPLPAIKPYGVVLQISMAKNKRFFQVNKVAAESFQLKNVHIVGTMSQNLVFKITRDISSGEVKGTVPTQDLPSGILTITVFDESWKPLAERITYINNEEYVFKPELEVLHWGMNKRARNDIQITVPDSLISSLSVSVTDAGIPSDSSDNIISRLLLTGDLKGQVFNPAYYFSNNSDSVARHLDLIMLTHGWRRFKWDDVAAGKLPDTPYPRDTSYLTLSGRVYGSTASELKDAGSIILLIKQPKVEGSVVMLPLAADGTFNEPNLILFDSATIYYQFPKGKKMDGTSVRFLENKMTALKNNYAAKGLFLNSIGDTTGNYRQSLLAMEASQLLKLYEGKLLENVVVKGKMKSPIQVMDEKYTSGLFAGGDGYQFDLINDPLAGSQFSIFTYLQGRVAGLQISNATGGSAPTLSWRGGSPQLYLNETPTDADMISSVSVNDVAYIKVFRPPFMGGFNGANGAIAIYTRRGDDIKSAPGKGLANNVINGYSEIKQFYSPNYSAFKPENEQKDIRTTLYWNPQLITNPKNNKVSFTFYNNDVTKAFHVVVEGMTRDGKLARIDQLLE